MRNKKSPWILVILLLSGAVIGGIAGEMLSRYSYFAWVDLGGIGYREVLAFTLNSIDLHVIKFGFDFTLRVNAGSIAGMLLGILIFLKT